MNSNVDNLLEDLEVAYKDTLAKHGERQAIGAILAFLVKRDSSFISKIDNREKLNKYSVNDICFFLIEHLIIKFGHEKDTIELGKQPDASVCYGYEDAKNIVINYLIRYDKKNNKIAFGDVMNIIRMIQLNEKIKNYLVNSFVLDKFVNKISMDIVNIPFAIKYSNNDDEVKLTELSGLKIINYIKNEYNLNK